jgi:predicted  nucleic acid-binding Zn-ribbon protein
LVHLNERIKELENLIQAYKNEVGTELLHQLNQTERSELNKLNEEVAKLKEQVIKASTDKSDVSERTVEGEVDGTAV